MMGSGNNVKIMDVIELTKKLMAIPSVSGDELAMLAFLEDILLEYGFSSIRKIPLEDGTYCLAASKGKSDAWIVGHTDTVPGSVPIEVRGGKLFGRGSCDTKGNIAATLVASKGLSNINLLFTVREESDFGGAKRATEDEEVIRGKRFLVLEPTESKLLDGQRGAILLEISAEGVQKHSAFIEASSENAIHAVVKTLGILEERRFPFWNVGTLHGGIAKNIVAPLCRAEAVIRPTKNKEFKETLLAIRDIRDANKNVSIDIKIALEPLEGKHQSLGFTEAFFFRGQGRRVNILGAGDLHVAHSPNEYVPIAELEALPEKITVWARGEK